MITDKKIANAVGGKTARACDSCIRKRARWYCAADDAFLCQSCDASVHSANPLASRHERVRLKTASFEPPISSSDNDSSVPSWHRGVTRKARTPRHGKQANHDTKNQEQQQSMRNPFSLVPDMGVDETSFDESEEQLLYRVPIYDPFMAELCTSTNSDDAVENKSSSSKNNTSTLVLKEEEQREESGGDDVHRSSESKVFPSGYGHDMDNLNGVFSNSEMDLAEFAADVESLLGKGLDNGSFGMEGLGLMECKEKDSVECWVKLEEREEEIGGADGSNNRPCHFDMEIDMSREPFELSFDYESQATCEEEDQKVVAVGSMPVMNNNDGMEQDGAKKKRKILLSLDYDAVISAWASQGSPWTAGSRPDFDPDDCWPSCIGTCGIESHNTYGEFGGLGGNATIMGDGGREARVSRYREKRRTRLFSKKIRYEVRKLNAEKRPRMKGRFVKRASFAGPAFPAKLSK